MREESDRPEIGGLLTPRVIEDETATVVRSKAFGVRLREFARRNPAPGVAKVLRELARRYLPQGAGETLRQFGRRRLPLGAVKILGGVASLALFVLAGFVLAQVFASIRFADLRAAMAATSAEQILGALLLTAFSYVALTGYDALALRQLRARVPYRVTSLASFTSYAISFTLGFPLITGGSVRFWIYSRVGLSAAKVASLTLIAGVTFWLGMTAVVGAGLVARAGTIAVIDHAPTALNWLLGVLALVGVVAYIVWVSMARRRVRIRGFRLELPGLGLTLGQMVLGAADLCCAAGALFALLSPERGLDFFTFVSIYVFACILGVISHAPGGIGVFEATMLHAVPAHSQESVLASLLLFRIIYYLVPFVLALALLGADEGSRRWSDLRDAMLKSIENRE